MVAKILSVVNGATFQLEMVLSKGALGFAFTSNRETRPAPRLRADRAPKSGESRVASMHSGLDTAVMAAVTQSFATTRFDAQPGVGRLDSEGDAH